MKFLLASVVLTTASVEAWVSPSSPTRSSSTPSCRPEASSLCAEPNQFGNYQYGTHGNGGWNEDGSFHERPVENQWNGNNQYEGDAGYNNANYNPNNFFEQPNPQQQYDAHYQYNSQQYQGELNQEYHQGQQQYPSNQQDYNNGQQQYDPQYQDGPNQGYYNEEYFPPSDQGYNEEPNGAYDGMNDSRLSRPGGAISLLDDMFDDPFFDDPFFDSFFSMPTPFSMLSPFYRSRRRRGSSSGMINSNFASAFSMLDRMREKMEDFSNGGREFLQRTEESNRVLVNKAERYLNDDVACRMALGVGSEDRIRLGPILGASSSMAYASVWDGEEQRRQEKRNQRNLLVGIDGPQDPRMEAVVRLTAFDDDEIQSMILQTRDGREISVPVIGRDKDSTYTNGNYDDGRYLNEDRRDGPPPPGVIDAEVVEQRR